MYTRRYVPTSCYFRQQLHSNAKRMKKLAELQSKMILQDLDNNQLRDQLTHLQTQNNLLKNRLMNKYTPTFDFSEIANKKYSAIDRAIEVLREKEEKLRKTSSSFNSHQYNHKSWVEKRDCKCMQDEKTKKNRNNRTMSQLQNSPDCSVKLNKNVYFSPERINKEPQERISNSVPPKLIERDEDSKSVLLEVQNKFPSRVNQFETKKPYLMLEEYEKKDECISQMENSEFPEGIKSAMFDRFQGSRQKRKKKIFLTIVSQSSVVKKD